MANDSPGHSWLGFLAPMHSLHSGFLLLPLLLLVSLCRTNEVQDNTGLANSIPEEGQSETESKYEGLVECFDAFYSYRCWNDGERSNCGSCLGIACYKIGGILDGEKAFTYGCVAKGTPLMDMRCYQNRVTAGWGVACYCKDRDFCNGAAALLPFAPLLLPILFYRIF